MLRMIGFLAAATFLLAPQTAVAHVTSSQAQGGNCVYCSYCFFGGEGHQATQPGDLGAPHSVCVPTPTCGHPTCASASLSPEDVQRLKELDTLLDDVTTKGIEVLASILTDFPDLATLNVERSAIQVVSACPENTRLIAHVPLSTEQVAMLKKPRESLLLAAN